MTYPRFLSRALPLAACALLALFVMAAPTAAQKGKRGGDRWGRNYFPNVPLISHEGEKVRFYDDLVEGKIVVINFIYTSCPDSCPLETARLREVQQILGDRVGDDVFFYSISIDPEVDTPEVLADYVRKYDLGPGWTFFTGDESDIVLLRKKLGLYIAEINQDDSNDHNLSLIIGNQSTGRWQKSSPFENPYILADQIGRWLDNFRIAPELRDYDAAPKLRDVSKGETLWRTRCMVCHSIGPTPLDKVGPDLFAVSERRERPWLERWLAEPDVMLEEGDSIALGLRAAYNDVPMPNMQLNDREIELLLDHIDKVTAEVRAADPTLAAAEAPEEKAPCCEKRTGLVVSHDDEGEDEHEDVAASLAAGDTGGGADDGQPFRFAGLSAAGLASVGAGLLLGVATLAIGLRRREEELRAQAQDAPA